MPFWTETDASLISEPKRKFRFTVQIDGIESGESSANVMWYAKGATKPSFSIATTEHKYLNHTFYYPGSVTWNEVEIKLVDPVDPDMTATLSDIVVAAGYVIPGTPDQRSTLAKGGAVGSLGQVTINQINANGDNLEQWVLKNAFITDINYGDLEYGADDINELSIKLRYDWATCEVFSANGSGGSSAKEGAGGNGPFFGSTS